MSTLILRYMYIASIVIYARVIQKLNIKKRWKRKVNYRC